jgi:hypothetical protein
LHVQRDPRDFIQKKRSSICQLDPARLRGRSILLSEECALLQLRGAGSAVDLDEAFVPSSANPVDSARNRFLSRTHFAKKQNARITLGKVLRLTGGLDEWR